MQITGDQQLLKEINRMALVCHLCSHPGLSRADLAETLGLTKSTVSLLVRELVEQGWIVEREMLVTGSLGRRPTPLHINPERLVLLGADVGIENIRIVATSLTGRIIASTVIEYVDTTDTKACIEALAKGFVRVSKLVENEGREIAGLGVGLPGGVDETAGVLHFAPNLGWRNVKVAALLTEYLSGTELEGLPLFLQNEADVAALGELEFADQMGSDPLVYVSISYGVGAGVIVNDRLLTGRNGFAGEVGHTILELNGPVCSCGRRGCAEALIGFRSLLRDPTNLTTPAPTAKLQQIRSRVVQGDAVAVEAAERAGRYLGVLLQNLWVAYDPVRIVLGGAALDLGSAFLQPALQTFKSYATAAQLAPPLIQMSRFGENAVAVGAAGLVRYRLTRPLTSPANSVNVISQT
jgi:predicted NBD/HSP70 family sugar kinase